MAANTRRLAIAVADDGRKVFRGMLAHHGFGSFVTHPFLWGYVRLLGAEKLEVGGEG